MVVVVRRPIALVAGPIVVVAVVCIPDAGRPSIDRPFDSVAHNRPRPVASEACCDWRMVVVVVAVVDTRPVPLLDDSEWVVIRRQWTSIDPFHHSREEEEEEEHGPPRVLCIEEHTPWWWSGRDPRTAAAAGASS